MKPTDSTPPDRTPNRNLINKWKTLVSGGDGPEKVKSGVTIAKSPMENFERQNFLGFLPRIDPDAELAEFQITKTLGQGGMGVVRLARQTSLWREVAIKTLQTTEVDSQGSQDLLQESWITGMLEHPNIVPIHSLGVDENGAPMLVMKRVEGISWGEAMDEPELIPDSIRAGRDLLETHLYILMQVCNAVEFAHSNGIIHCDLKPDNVMLGAYGEVYLLDWGIAVSLEDDGTNRLPLAKDIDDIAGTPAYIAPEMTAGEGHRIREWSDIYLLGAVLHHIITGEPRHDGANIMAILLKAFQSAPVEYGSDIPRELAEICNRATHVIPEKRFETVADFRSAITAFLQHRDSRRLANEANTRLELLSMEVRDVIQPQAPVTEKQAARIHRHFTECRFGFEQALSIWEGNDLARTHSQNAIEVMIEFEFHQRDDTAIAVLLEEVPGFDERFGERLSTLRSELAEEAREIQKNKEISRAVDLDLASRSRSIMCILLGFLFGGVPFITHWLIAQGWATLTFQDYFTQFAIILVGSGLVVFFMRRRLLENAVNARIITCIFVILGGCLIMRLLGYSLGLTPAGCIALENGLLGFALFMMAVTVDRRLWTAGIAFLVGAFGGSQYPDYILFFDGGSNAAALWLIAFAWRKPQNAGEKLGRESY